jgi:hypothetical protein
MELLKLRSNVNGCSPCMEAVFDAFCTAGGGGGGGGGGWGWGGGGGGGGRAGAMVGRSTFQPVFRFRVFSGLNPNPKPSTLNPIVPGCNAGNCNAVHSVYFSL